MRERCGDLLLTTVDQVRERCGDYYLLLLVLHLQVDQVRERGCEGVDDGRLLGPVGQGEALGRHWVGDGLSSINYPIN